MSNLNADLEAGFGDGPPVIREDQAYLLENQVLFYTKIN